MRVFVHVSLPRPAASCRPWKSGLGALAGCLTPGQHLRIAVRGVSVSRTHTHTCVAFSPHPLTSLNLFFLTLIVPHRFSPLSASIAFSMTGTVKGVGVSSRRSHPWVPRRHGYGCARSLPLQRELPPQVVRGPAQVWVPHTGKLLTPPCRLGISIRPGLHSLRIDQLRTCLPLHPRGQRSPLVEPRKLEGRWRVRFCPPRAVAPGRASAMGVLIPGPRTPNRDHLSWLSASAVREGALGHSCT